MTGKHIKQTISWLIYYIKEDSRHAFQSRVDQLEYQIHHEGEKMTDIKNEIAMLDNSNTEEKKKLKDDWKMKQLGECRVSGINTWCCEISDFANFTNPRSVFQMVQKLEPCKKKHLIAKMQFYTGILKLEWAKFSLKLMPFLNEKRQQYQIGAK